jgi:hypothetical protein
LFSANSWGRLRVSGCGIPNVWITRLRAAIAHMQALKILRGHQDRGIANARELLSHEPAGSTAKISLVPESGALKVHVEISRAASQR